MALQKQGEEVIDNNLKTIILDAHSSNHEVHLRVLQATEKAIYRSTRVEPCRKIHRATGARRCWCWKAASEASGLHPGAIQEFLQEPSKAVRERGLVLALVLERIESDSTSAQCSQIDGPDPLIDQSIFAQSHLTGCDTCETVSYPRKYRSIRRKMKTL